MYIQENAGRLAHFKTSINTYGVDDEAALASFIRQRKDEMLAAQDDFHLFHLLMRDLEKTLLRDNLPDALPTRAVDQMKSDELIELNNLYCLWETKLENRFVYFLKNGVTRHYLDYMLYARFDRLIEREVSLLRGFKPSRLLFIGSGPMPITALCLQQRLGVPIDCLEKYQAAVDESKSVMKLLSCDNVINIYQGMGEEVDASQYDVVLVALLAKPKHDILTQIRDTARDDIRIICRTSEGSRKVFYEPTEDNDIPIGLRMVAHEQAGMDDTISSCLLKKVTQ